MTQRRLIEETFPLKKVSECHLAPTSFCSPPRLRPAYAGLRRAGRGNDL
jgi:hypothetical protein